MRELFIVAWMCLTAPCLGQYLVEQPQDAPKVIVFGPPEDQPANLGQAIGVGAERSYAELEARVKVLEQLVPDYIPTWTWPGSETAGAFDRLRTHMAGDNIHPRRDVAKWSRAELAFVHDCEHVQELLDGGKPLPILKDQRLRDWLRSKSPAKPLKNVARAVRKLVIHSRLQYCPGCEQMKPVAARLSAEGWDVQTLYAERKEHSSPRVPMLFVCINDVCYPPIEGPASYETLKAMETPTR